MCRRDSRTAAGILTGTRDLTRGTQPKNHSEDLVLMSTGSKMTAASWPGIRVRLVNLNKSASRSLL